MSINMNEGTYAYVLAQTAMMNCRVAGMVAENQHRLHHGHSVAYTEEAFAQVEKDFSASLGHNAIMEMCR